MAYNTHLLKENSDIYTKSSFQENYGWQVSDVEVLENDYVKILILNNDITYSKIGQKKLSYNSANEINYLAFNLATEEYHNELYEELKNRYGANLGIKDFDFITKQITESLL